MAEKPVKKVTISNDNVHLSELVWETVVYRNGQAYRQVWLFQGEYFPCGRCKSIDVQFMSLPTGVYKSCPRCKFAEGISPINYETKDHIAELIQEKAIGLVEAWQILRSHKSHPYAPQNLPLPSEQRRRSKRSIVLDE